MSDYPRLKFPTYGFRLKSVDGADRIWDEVRKAWLVLTPEEWVRRHLVRWLIEQRGVTPQLIVQEHVVCVQGQPQRADVVVFGQDVRPLLLAECKEPGCEITQTVYDQAVRYNFVLGARYLMLTNGQRHYIYEHLADGQYEPLREFPELG